METVRIISWLRDKADRAEDLSWGRMMKAAADRLEKLENENRWIPVTERLPEVIPCGAGTAYSEAVNALTSGRKVLTAIWNGADFIADAEFWEAEGEEITHWAPVLLPLPEPPNEVATCQED